MVRHGPWSSLPQPGRGSKGSVGHCWLLEQRGLLQVLLRGSRGSLLRPRPAASSCAHRAPLQLLTLALGTVGRPGGMEGQKGGRKEALTKHVWQYWGRGHVTNVGVSSLSQGSRACRVNRTEHLESCEWLCACCGTQIKLVYLHM